ncbi:hypothetical protein Nepgr_017916 [Nepenthes gracilis]|uniref:Protein kinase domain-containing protein n=1 Tax=Nepenthes gracilis TaxID=150966 RepID=A0AAD3SSC2_NEPGR|nr:hypothetical protein Nepgr_017916 [Nepenthes gracilis]
MSSNRRHKLVSYDGNGAEYTPTKENYAETKAAEQGKLAFVRDDRRQFGLSELLRASAEVLGSGSFRSSYKAAMSNGEIFVVKRFRQMNKVGRRDFCE